MMADDSRTQLRGGGIGGSDQRINRWWLVAAVIWVLLIAASFGWNWIQMETSLMALAESELRSALENGSAYQHWVAEQGGVYVRPTKKAPPNPRLEHLPESDLTTTSGIRLTLINPAYLTRLVQATAQPSHGPRVHITSLHPLRPANAPDAWERAALTRIQNGATEVLTVVSLDDGRRRLRLMRPLAAKESCRKCHAPRGHQESDLQGGLSVSMHLDPYMAELAEHRLRLTLAHVTIGCLGLIGLFMGGYRLRVSSKQLWRSENQFRSLFDQSPMSIRIYDSENGEIIDANPSACAAFGVSSVEILKTIDFWMDPPFSHSDALGWIRKTVAEGPQRFQWLSRKASGELFWEEIYMNALAIDGRLQIMAVGLDITNRKRAGITILRQALAMEAADDGIAIVSSEETYIYLNKAYALIHGYGQPQELIGKPWRLLYGPEELTRFDREIMPAFARQGRYRGCVQGRRKDGSRFDQEISLTALPRGGWICIVRDITERRQVEAEREKLQAQLLQAQKMESVGRLAGGVAHDYNNMLSVIIGYTQMAMEEAGPSNPLHEDLGEILTAARRSADITRQLLAFARKQDVAPKVLDLNNTVESMLKMLRRLLGEDIELSWKPGMDLWAVKIDPSQLDQVIANLCVNARDAINGIGHLRIQTENVHHGQTDDNLSDFSSGDYVMLAVSDDGCGMDARIREHLFEPFFTTKPMGKGTGLGLATVYGIVKQNNGGITVFSEPGKGATFRIYLPRYQGEVLSTVSPEESGIRPGRGETVLIVEDEAAVLKLGQQMLEKLEYRVFAAASADEALMIIASHTEKIHLAIIDMVMPQMDGLTLARRLRSLYPDLKVLFMSGYMGDTVDPREVLKEGGHFIQKPFSMPSLGAKVRDVLDEESPPTTRIA
jgi:two-component system, cell cycle sensor histidine kinase and response regulator CckA